jgi:ABC-type uncharacterized transport system auxiliary subunit
MKALRPGAMFVCCLLLGGCHILDSGKPARQVYLLQTPSAPARVEAAPGTATLIISVNAVPGLDTDRILVLGNDARLNPVANAHWTDHMPEVFTSITRRYLSDTHLFRTVRQGSIARPDEWLLELELQAFYGLQDSSGETSSVVLQLEGLLRCGNTQKVLRIDQRAAAGGDNLAALVAAHQRVIDTGMEKLSADMVLACAQPSNN